MPSFVLDPGLVAAMAVALVVWIGIFVFLWRLDRQARELRRRLDQRPNAEAPSAPRATLETRNVHAQARVVANDE